MAGSDPAVVGCDVSDKIGLLGLCYLDHSLPWIASSDNSSQRNEHRALSSETLSAGCFVPMSTIVTLVHEALDLELARD